MQEKYTHHIMAFSEFVYNISFCFIIFIFSNMYILYHEQRIKITKSLLYIV